MDYLFADLLPTPPTSQTSSDTICRIEYDKDYKRAIGLLEAVLAKAEYSPRVLHLTDYIVNQCEGHYTAWSLRRRCLRSVEDLRCEQQWISRYTAECPKNYQLWQHRMLVFKALRVELEGIKEVKEELDDIREELARNPKNYHAWQYRQWVIQEYGASVDDEVEMCKFMLHKDDPFNNSVYNHLAFMHHHLSLPLDTIKAVLNGLPQNDSLTALQLHLDTIKG